MLNQINCCHVAIAGLIGWTINTIIQNIQTAKIKAKGVELELRTKELEKKNGKEMKKIEEVEQKNKQLQQKVEQLEKKLNNHAKNQ